MRGTPASSPAADPHSPAAGRHLPVHASVAAAGPQRPVAAPDEFDVAPSLLDAALRHPRLPAAGAALFGLLGVVFVALNWFSYHATARVVLRDPWEADIGVTDRPVGGDFQRFVRSEARFLQTDEVVDAAAESLSQPADELADALSASATTSGEFIDVSIRGGSAGAAEARLDAVLAAYSTARRDVVDGQADAVLRTIEQEAAALPAVDRADLDRRAANLRIALAAYGDGVAFVEKQPATADMGAAKKLAIPFVAALIGAGLGAVVAWIWAGRRRNVEDVERLARQWGLTFCGMLGAPDAEGRTADRVAADATLLSLASILRDEPPRSDAGAYVVVLAAATPTCPALTAAHQLADAAALQGAACQVVDGGHLARPDDRFEVFAALAAPDCDLLLFACGVPHRDFSALRAAGEADALVLVVEQGDDADEVLRTLSFYDSVGRRPRALVALPGRAAT